MPSTSKPLSTATKVHREIPSERLWYERRGTQYLRIDRKGTFDNAGIGKLLYGICIRVNIIYGFPLLSNEDISFSPQGKLQSFKPRDLMSAYQFH